MPGEHNKTLRNYLFGAGCFATFLIGAGLYLDGTVDIVSAELAIGNAAAHTHNQLIDLDPNATLQVAAGLLLSAAGLASLSRIEG